MSLIKRTHIYVQHPKVYEIAGCPTSSEHQINWSEYENHLWCFDCEKDFIPEHDGIFDGPIPIGAAKLMGISFDRMNLTTWERVAMPYTEATDESDLRYLVAQARYLATWNHE